MNKQYKFTIQNINNLSVALKEIFKWNNNKNIILLPFKGETYKLHFRLLHPFSYSHENPTVKFTVNAHYNTSDFKKEIENIDFQQNNIFMATHYIENIDKDYLIVKYENIKNYGFDINKEVLIFELHTNLLSSNNIITKIDSIIMDFIFDNNFNQLNYQKINNKIIKINGGK